MHNIETETMKWRECQVTSPEGGGPVTRCHGQNYMEHPVVILLTQVLARRQHYRGHPVHVGRGARGEDPGGHLHVGTRPGGGGGGSHGLEEAGHQGGPALAQVRRRNRTAAL